MGCKCLPRASRFFFPLVSREVLSLRVLGGGGGRRAVLGTKEKKGVFYGCLHAYPTVQVSSLLARPSKDIVAYTINEVGLPFLVSARFCPMLVPCFFFWEFKNPSLAAKAVASPPLLLAMTGKSYFLLIQPSMSAPSPG